MKSFLPGGLQRQVCLLGLISASLSRKREREAGITESVRVDKPLTLTRTRGLCCAHQDFSLLLAFQLFRSHTLFLLCHHSAQFFHLTFVVKVYLSQGLAKVLLAVLGVSCFLESTQRALISHEPQQESRGKFRDLRFGVLWECADGMHSSASSDRLRLARWGSILTLYLKTQNTTCLLRTFNFFKANVLF